jgi:quinohemoprotein ethanol dehydrogenase
MKYIPLKSTLLILLCLTLTISCEKKTSYTEIEDVVLADENRTEDWLAYGRTHNERRFSPLSDINVDNIGSLKVDWYMDLPNDIGLVSTPLVVDGILYFTGTMNIVRAVNAVNGELIWEYDPKVAETIGNTRQVGWKHNRGLSFYRGKIFAATWDGRLIAIEAKTGKEIWATATFDRNRSLFITGAPKAFKGKVIIGNGGTENGPARGFVTAYDTETGEEAWKFYIVPGNPAEGFENEAMEMAAKTWTGEWWKHGGGGNSWHGFTYDAELDVLYIGTGNGSPWNRKIRSPEGGDNLFLCSILALDPDTGEYLWHYQTTPGEMWDYNSSMDIVLADLTINGETIKALLHAPKNGFFYVINRETGKLISAEPFVETSWATHIDMNTGKPVETENARYVSGPVDITPSPWGGHSWQSMSYNPQTGLVYIPALHSTATFSDEGIDLEAFQAIEFGGGIGVNLRPSGNHPREYPASLIAWDPVQQQPAWTIPQDVFWNAGTLTTGGNLVFQGRADGKFLAYNAQNGEMVWSFDTGLGISAPPITYKINGKQYISILVGFGGGYARGGWDAHRLGWSYRIHIRRLITFSLEGIVEMSRQPPPFYPRPIIVPDFEIDQALASAGEQLYWGCFNCHGGGMFSGGMSPDLRASAVALDKAAFASVVRDGSKINLGMPSYPDISDQELEALQHFIRLRAKETLPAYEMLTTGASIENEIADEEIGH